MASSRSLIVTGAVQDVIGWQLVQLFYHVNTDGFRLLPWVCGSVRFAVTHQHLEMFLHHLIPEEEPLEKKESKRETVQTDYDWSKLRFNRFSLVRDRGNMNWSSEGGKYRKTTSSNSMHHPAIKRIKIRKEF